MDPTDDQGRVSQKEKALAGRVGGEKRKGKQSPPGIKYQGSLLTANRDFMWKARQTTVRLRRTGMLSLNCMDR